MHSFLWSGKDSEGKKRSERVEAENARAARAILEAQGWTDLQLIKDEIGDVVKRRHRAESRIQVPELTPDQEASRFWGKRKSFAMKWWNSLQGSFVNIALIVLILGFGIYAHKTGSIFRGGTELLLILLLFPVLSLFYSQTRRNYARLNRAKVYGRWNEVLKYVEKLKRSHELTRIGVGKVELARNRALAIAHLGRLDEAISEFKKVESSATTPAWLYASHLGGIYKAGGEYERALECQMKVVAEKPDMSSGWIDLAGLLVQKMKRPGQAREALARAGKLELTPLGKPHMLLHEGVILWREARLSEAKPRLEQSLMEFEPFAKKPLVEGSILKVKSYLCAVNRSLGNQAEAGRLLKEEIGRAHV